MIDFIFNVNLTLKVNVNKKHCKLGYNNTFMVDYRKSAKNIYIKSIFTDSLEFKNSH